MEALLIRVSQCSSDRRRYVLPGCEIAWGLITVGTYAVKSPQQLYVLRFLLGLLEGTSFVGIQYVLGSWYKATEIGKRTAIFANSAYVGTAFGGYIFSGVLAGMNGYKGMAAWRWAFVVDGVITSESRSFRVLLRETQTLMSSSRDWPVRPDLLPRHSREDHRLLSVEG